MCQLCPCRAVPCSVSTRSAVFGGVYLLDHVYREKITMAV